MSGRDRTKGFGLPGLGRGWAAAAAMVAAVLWGAGCGPAPETADSGDARYGAWDPVRVGVKSDPPAAEGDLQWPADGLVSVAQSELVPYSAWNTRSRVVRWFAGLPATGHGGPTFFAYSSPTGIATVKVEGRVEGSQMRENWILVGFPGAENWKDWDSPWAIFLQRRPESVGLGTNGVDAVFSGEAGQFALLPLYGYYKPPQKDRGVLAGQGLKEKELFTWEWPIVVARDPLTRLRYWAGATRWFPYQAESDLTVARGGTTVTEAFRFRALEIPDDWRTRTVHVAPVSPALGLAFQSEPSFAAEVKPRPFDFEMPTPAGPFYGVPDAKTVTVTLPVGALVSSVEVPRLELEAGASAEDGARFARARDRVRQLMRERFGTAGSAGALTQDAWKRGFAWYARALPWCEAEVRTNAIAAMRTFLRSQVLTGAGLLDLGVGLPHGGGDARWRRDLIEGLWAYVHHSGDRALLKESWGGAGLKGVIAEGPGSDHGGWAGYGASTAGEEGWRLGTAVAAARLAYLAEDAEAWSTAMARVAQEVVLEHIRWRGGRWVRGQQPWHAMPALSKETGLSGPRPLTEGWQPVDLASAPELGRFLGRMASDVETARWVGRQLGQEVAGRASLAAWRRTLESAAAGSEVVPGDALASARVAGWLLSPSVTNQWTARLPAEIGAGPDAAVIGACLGLARAVGGLRVERLIPGNFPAVRGTGRAAASRSLLSWGSGLTHQVTWDEGARDGGIRFGIRWPSWRGEDQAGWSFGRVEFGDEVPAGAGSGAALSSVKGVGQTTVLTVRGRGGGAP